MALHALLEERHVTRAATRIGVGQPAASAMLVRLRRHFDDELLIRVGNHYELTPLGATLREQAVAVLELGDRLFATKSKFDPAHTEREFVIGISDYALGMLGPALLNRFEADAPHGRLTFRLLHTRSDHDARDIAHDDMAIHAVDGMVLPYGTPYKHLSHIELMRDEWVCIVAADNDLVSQEPTAAELSALRWVLAYHDYTLDSLGLGQLQARGFTMRSTTVVDNFRILPQFVAGTSRAALIQRGLAEAIAPEFDLRVVPLPVAAQPLVLAFWWHPLNTPDSGHAWLRGLLQDAATTVDEVSGAS